MQACRVNVHMGVFTDHGIVYNGRVNMYIGVYGPPWKHEDRLACYHGAVNTHLHVYTASVYGLMGRKHPRICLHDRCRCSHGP
eukprot:1386232-Amorphochlora_amoeboformis.AAC.1